MIKLLDISFYVSADTTLIELQRAHAAALDYTGFLNKQLTVDVIKQLDHDSSEIINGIKYFGFKNQPGFWRLPFKIMRYVKMVEPDVVIVQGLVFPVQLLALKVALPKKTKLLVQHHGEKPFTGLKKYLQVFADRFIDAYLFTSFGNAAPWLQKAIISKKSKCYELLEASTHFKKQDREYAKNQLGLTGNFNFLWVGRLNKGKDPFTVLKAFAIFLEATPGANLYMIYHTEELLTQIKKMVTENDLLQQKVKLIGRQPHGLLETWYNAADFFISGSHFEGSGYALLEAMACGCIPVVTKIPSFSKITGGGKFGLLYEAGNKTALVEILLRLKSLERDTLSEGILQYFESNLSFAAIANDLHVIVKKLTGK